MLICEIYKSINQTFTCSQIAISNVVRYRSDMETGENMVISGRDNPRIKRLIKLISNRRARAAEGEFVIEGLRGCADAAKQFMGSSKPELTAVFVSESAWQKYRDTEYINILNMLDQRIVYTVSDEIADRISDSLNSQGVFATARIPDLKLDKSALDHEGKYIVLDNIQDPGNLGTIIRTADAVGADGVVLTNNCCDLYNPKTVRSAMGSISRIKTYSENDFEAVVSAFSDRGIVNIASVVSGGSDLVGFGFPKGCAVYIGNEGNGMPAEHVEMCDEKITISMHGSIESLNAAMAATIILWEMTRGTADGC